MNKTEFFTEKYRELEEVGKITFNLPEDGTVIARLEMMPEFRHVKARLSYCRQVRALLNHERKFEKEFLVTPSDPMIDLLCQLVDRINKIPMCKDHCIPVKSVYTCSFDDYVVPAMNAMKEHNYTHVPLLDNGVVLGVFSENTLFSYVLDNEIVSVDRETRFQDLSTYLPINKHQTEVFRFLPWNAQTFSAKKLFEDALKRFERIGMVFLTQNGKETEKLMGIITPWDILGNQIII